MSDEAAENLAKLIEELRKAEDAQKNMTKEEKSYSTTKMCTEKGDIGY